MLGSMTPDFVGEVSLDAAEYTPGLTSLPPFAYIHCQHLFYFYKMKITTTCSPVALWLDWDQRLGTWHKPSGNYYRVQIHIITMFSYIWKTWEYKLFLVIASFYFHMYVCLIPMCVQHAQIFGGACVYVETQRWYQESPSVTFPWLYWSRTPQLNPVLEDVGSLASQFSLEIPCLCFLYLWVPQLQDGIEAL